MRLLSETNVGFENPSCQPCPYQITSIRDDKEMPAGHARKQARRLRRGRAGNSLRT
jgi:hypothetical protein